MFASFVLVMAIANVGLVRSLSQLSTTVVDVNQPSQRSVSATFGCALDLKCSGSGTGIQWTNFLSTTPLQNTTNTFVTISNTNGTWQANLNFRFLKISDQGFYACKILMSVPKTITAYVMYDPNPILIEPILDRNISTATVGDTITIGCPVTTCASNVTLTMSPPIAQRSKIFYVNDAANSVQNFLVTAGANIAGAYTFTAEGVFFDGLTTSTFTTTQSFNIVGTPKAPTTAPPTTVPSKGSTSSPSTGGSPGSVASIAVQLLSLVLTVSLAALLSVKF